MASVSDNVMKFFRSSSNQTAGPAAPQKLTRRSSGMGEISRLLNSQEALCVLDMGATSANNIRFFTGKGHKNYSEDLLRSSLDPALRIQDSDGKLVVDSKKFLDENLVYRERPVRRGAVLESAGLHGREPGEADHRPFVVGDEAGRITAGILSHAGRGPGFDLLSLSCHRHRHAGDARGEVRAARASRV